MARLFNDVEQKQIFEAEKGLREAGLDVDFEYAEKNANLILNHFEQNPRIPVTVESIYKFIEQRKNDFVWRTPAQRDYDKVAAENPAAAQQVAEWLVQHGGRPGALIHTGDQGFQNSWNILEEIRGREINDQTIREAIGRIEAPVSKFATRKRPALHRVPTPRPVDPRQHQDDGTGFLGKNVNEPNWKRVQREREEREAAEAKSGAAASVAASAAAVREAKRQAEELRGAHHSDDAQLQSIFVMVPGTHDVDWVATLRSRLALQKSLQKHRETARFIR
jgi:hypothetical protein